MTSTKSSSRAQTAGAFASVIAIVASSMSFATEVPVASASLMLHAAMSPDLVALSDDLSAPLPGTPEVVLVAANVSQQQLDDLANLGKSLAKKDPLARELRRRQSGKGQFGFDVGMGVAKGQTLPGPGKDRIGEALSSAERLGFDVAVKYSLERNNNLKLAKVGAEIAEEDPEVQDARVADRDVFYWLGFDIATAIYGDPALGAQGNTATGPGANKIRDALSYAGQRGFNDAVKFHLARSY